MAITIFNIEKRIMNGRNRPYFFLRRLKIGYKREKFGALTIYVYVVFIDFPRRASNFTARNAGSDILT